MESYRGEGDLNDIVRASGGCPPSCATGQGSATLPAPSWQQFPSDPLNFPSSAMEGPGLNAFGDPFSSIRDPLLNELSSTYFSSPNSADHHRIINNNTSSTTVEETSSFPGSATIVGQSKLFEEDTRSPCNIFSRIQISPISSSKLTVSPCDSPMMAATGVCVSPRGIKAPAVLTSDMINGSTTSKSCLIDNTGPVQISSPRNLGIKRRKSQVKKVVCIPAPAAANSRSSGEVVPSDLWAWRKYGQKPIKGSPYPRGYYRCSSSKGCSARKQVERSRTDPNMLVITYTSEHNHPWPTQRNALAGSTRSQPSKTNNASSSSSASKINPKEEELKDSSNDALSPTNVAAVSSTASASAKEETEDVEKQLEVELDGAEFGDQIQTYTPALIMPPTADSQAQQAEDFFAELDEIETDPLKLLFPQGFCGADQDEQKEKKTMGPFGLFDWPGNNNAPF
ncbi:WRKY DNA-BINDING PROTEIN 14, WRKY DNA-binding protein 14 [Hibiscus trionum]|uniref:WRKY DNA-BINDING PROTEIN 14, WRKY DNA-binding protein 14 n=1 Tax=Hibiscus trionum TaxID=183268 RepID=A0A9W7I9R6_HIBTR|nr:WRKY DNA-BINDING PROTEIN 14, WRKY DNA-binding protein 14 [Hibiscus trionum]